MMYPYTIRVKLINVYKNTLNIDFQVKTPHRMKACSGCSLHPACECVRK